jgi:hypothetical protein
MYTLRVLLKDIWAGTGTSPHNTTRAGAFSFFYTRPRIFIRQRYKLEQIRALECSLRGCGTLVGVVYADSCIWVSKTTVALGIPLNRGN